MTTDKYAILDRCLRDYGDDEQFVTDLVVSRPGLVRKAALGVASNAGEQVIWLREHEQAFIHGETDRVLILDGQPAIVISDGRDSISFTDRFTGDSMDWAPILKASTVARLRALADVIEKS